MNYRDRLRLKKIFQYKVANSKREREREREREIVKEFRKRKKARVKDSKKVKIIYRKKQCRLWIKTEKIKKQAMISFQGMAEF